MLRVLLLLVVAAAWFSTTAAAPEPPIRFEEIAQKSGLRFELRNGATGKFHQVELMAGGVGVLDYNNDGCMDIFFTNGAAIPGLRKTGPEYSNRLFRNNCNLTFTDVTAEAGVAGKGYSMATAIGDFDNDGAVDVLVAQNDGAPLLLRNYAGRRNHWLGLRLIGRKANIDAIGAKVVYRSGDLQRHLWKVAGGSYLSSHDPRIILGLGQRTKTD